MSQKGKKQKKSRNKRKSGSPGIQKPYYKTLSYEIVYDPILEEGDLPNPELDEEKQEIFDNVRKDPVKCAARLEKLIEQYPDDRVLYNFLANAYQLAGKRIKTREMIRKTYERFPDYFFGKIAYIELCMEDDDMDEAARVIDNKFHLMHIYPERTRFHVSEHMAFCSTLGYYFFRTGNFNTAAVYLDGLMAVDPDDVRTKRLARALGAHDAVISKLKALLSKK